jgi:hypothetical protein
VVIKEELHGFGLQLGRRCSEGGLLQEVGVEEAELVRAEVVLRPHLPLVVVLVEALALCFELVQLGTGETSSWGTGNALMRDRGCGLFLTGRPIKGEVKEYYDYKGTKDSRR